MRIMNEATMFKFIVEGDGVVFSVTARRRAYFFFLTSKRLGCGIAPITDPYPGIVEICEYDVARISENWEALSRVKLSHLRSRTNQGNQDPH